MWRIASDSQRGSARFTGTYVGPTTDLVLEAVFSLSATSTTFTRISSIISFLSNERRSRFTPFSGLALKPRMWTVLEERPQNYFRTDLTLVGVDSQTQTHSSTSTGNCEQGLREAFASKRSCATLFSAGHMEDDGRISHLRMAYLGNSRSAV